MRQPTLTLHVTLSVQPATEDRPAAIGLVFCDRDGRVLRRIGRTVGTQSREAAGFRGLLHALWLSRRFGARSVTIACDLPEVVGLAQGGEPIPDRLVGPYLQVRALVHAYKAVTLIASPAPEAAVAAVEAQRRYRDREVTVDDLPLWADRDLAAV